MALYVQGAQGYWVLSTDVSSFYKKTFNNKSKININVDLTACKIIAT